MRFCLVLLAAQVILSHSLFASPMDDVRIREKFGDVAEKLLLEVLAEFDNGRTFKRVQEGHDGRKDNKRRKTDQNVKYSKKTTGNSISSARTFRESAERLLVEAIDEFDNGSKRRKTESRSPADQKQKKESKLKKKLYKDDPGAAYKLGRRYYDGVDGVEKDDISAAKWFRISADKGHAKSQFYLGKCYYLGEGLDLDYAKALEWFERASDQGNKNAKYYLGLSYYNGHGVTRRIDKALKYFERAADLGQTEAQYKLGICYYDGVDVEKDKNIALEWFNKAAKQENVDAQYTLGLHYSEDDVNHENAAKWFKVAANQGHSDSQYRLGLCYLNGVGVEKLPTKAVKLFLKAAEQDHPMAQFQLGLCYFKGIGVSKSFVNAEKYLLKAANEGISDADAYLSACYNDDDSAEKSCSVAVESFKDSVDQGKDFEQNYEREGTLYDDAANQEHKTSQNPLKETPLPFTPSLKPHDESPSEITVNEDLLRSDVYPTEAVSVQIHPDISMSSGVQKQTQDKNDSVSAVQFMIQAAEEGNPEAQYYLGRSYIFGSKIDKNFEEGAKWYERAALQGHAHAQFNLGRCYIGAYGVERDIHKAMEWIAKAAESGLSAAQYKLGFIYQHGDVQFPEAIPKNLHLAVDWYQKAAAQGHDAAIKSLINLNIGVGYSYENARMARLKAETSIPKTISVSGIHQTLIFIDGSVQTFVNPNIQHASFISLNDSYQFVVHLPIENILEWMINCTGHHWSIFLKRKITYQEQMQALMLGSQVVFWNDMLIQADVILGTCDNSMISTSFETGLLRVSLKRQ